MKLVVYNNQNIVISNFANLKNINKKEPAKASSKVNSKNSLCRKAKGVLVINNLIFKTKIIQKNQSQKNQRWQNNPLEFLPFLSFDKNHPLYREPRHF